MDNTHINGSSPIDSIAATTNILQIVEGCKLLEANEVILNDHRSYAVDFNFEKYFSKQFSSWDMINHRILDPACRSQRNKFIKKLEELLDAVGLELQLDRACNQYSTWEELEVVD